MTDKLNNQSADSDSGKKNISLQPENDPSRLSGRERKPKMKRRPIIIVCTTFAAIFGTIAFSFHGWLPLCSGTAAAICASLALYTELRTHNVLKTWCRCWAILLGGFAMCGAIATNITVLKPSQGQRLVLSVIPGGGNASRVFLTNEFLRIPKYEKPPKEGINQSNLLVGISTACLIVPLEAGESNKVFRFIAENKSPTKISDLHILVAVPEQSSWLFDTNVWGDVEMNVMQPEKDGNLRLAMTDLKVRFAFPNRTLFPLDGIDFSITNFGVSTVESRPQSMVGIIWVVLRCDGFTSAVAMNIVYVEKSFSVSEPFVTKGRLNTNGTIEITKPTSTN